MNVTGYGVLALIGAIILIFVVLRVLGLIQVARKPTHLVDRLSERVSGEIERVSDTLADKVNTELLDDQRELPRGQFLDYWRANWADPQWRAQQHERMGDTGFYEATMEAFGAPKEEPLTRLAREGMAKQGVAQAQAAAPAPEPAPAPQGPGY